MTVIALDFFLHVQKIRDMHRIILSGIKHSGKSTIGWNLSSSLGLYFADLDDLILRDAVKYKTVRELYRDLGNEGFQEQEFKSLNHFLEVNDNKEFVLSLGGGTIENKRAIALLDEKFSRYFLDAHADDLFRRIMKNGIPPFLEGADPFKKFELMYTKRTDMYKKWADFVIDTRDKTPIEVSSEIESIIKSQT